MISIEKIGAQGDVLFRKVDSLPEHVVEAQKEDDQYVVAHSETGHHHTVSSMMAVVFKDPDNPMVLYLRMKEDHADVIHNRSWDTHETLRMKGSPGDVYEIRRQRQSTPEGWERVAD